MHIVCYLFKNDRKKKYHLSNPKKVFTLLKNCGEYYYKIWNVVKISSLIK